MQGLHAEAPPAGARPRHVDPQDTLPSRTGKPLPLLIYNTPRIFSCR
jgi:hypothetical protein